MHIRSLSPINLSNINTINKMSNLPSEPEFEQVRPLKSVGQGGTDNRRSTRSPLP
jgi:hypothetical protein